MKKNNTVPLSIIVILFATVICILLGVATFYISFTPTDSQIVYIPAARSVFQNPFVSDMHKATPYRIGTNKEMLILGIAVMQKILHDPLSLYPNVLLLIIAFFIASVLFYVTLKNWLNSTNAFLGFLFLITCFLPYQYILHGAHQVFVLMNFLLAVLSLQLANRRKIYMLLSGFFLGLTWFSSPTALFYLPYYLCFYVYFELKKKPDSQSPIFNTLLLAVSFAFIYVLFTLPNPLQGLKATLGFLNTSQSDRHLQRLWQQKIIPGKSLECHRLILMVKYIFLTQPILFIGYLGSVLYLIKSSAKKPILWGVILSGISTPVILEAAHISLFGRNYFSWVIGMILTITLVLYLFKQKHKGATSKRKKIFTAAAWSLLLLHCIYNAAIFFGDVYPSRMFRSKMYDWIAAKQNKKFFVYKEHPLNNMVIDMLNSPKRIKTLEFFKVDSLKDAEGGYFIVPPTTGKNIWQNCAGSDFRKDKVLNRLIDSEEIKKYAVASFPTLASSRILPLEEEYCAFIDLSLNSVSDNDRYKGKVWILDVDKLKKDGYF